jgi:hypothetical protein
MLFLRKKGIKIGTDTVDKDYYLKNFIDYLEKGHYAKVAEGTTVVYNFVLKCIYTFVGDAIMSFFILNLASQLFIGFIGFFIIKRWYKNHIYALSFFAFYFLLIWINNEQLSYKRNDLFLGVFFLGITYNILEIIHANSIRKRNFIYIGILLSLAFGTRYFSILFLLPYLVFVVYLLKNFQLKEVLKAQILFGVVFLIGTICIHYPSLKENGRLSFYNKDIDQKVVWMDINTLATKKMFDTNGVQIIRKDVYWKMLNPETRNSFVTENKIDINNLPKNILEYAVNYPIYYIKLIGLNTLNTVVYFFRHYGLLFLLPFLYLVQYFRKRIKQPELMPIVLFLTFWSSILLVINSVIEFRWFASFEILFYISVITSLNYFYKKNKYFANGVFFSSLIIMSMMNIRTIMNMM